MLIYTNKHPLLKTNPSHKKKSSRILKLFFCELFFGFTSFLNLHHIDLYLASVISFDLYDMKN